MPTSVHALLFQLGLQMLGHGMELALGPPGGDHHEVGHAGFSVEVDDDDVFGFIVVERLLDQGEKPAGEIKG